jgi:single-strand DNA-binding protein
MALDITGKLLKIFPIEEKSATFKTRDFVVEMPDGNYTQMVKFQLTQDRCPLVDSFREGDQVRVHFNLRGREWQGKYFTNLDAWRIEAVEGGSTPPPPQGEDPFGDTNFPEAPATPTFQDTRAQDDDLPF